MSSDTVTKDTARYTKQTVVVEADNCATVCAPGTPRSQMRSVDDLMTQGGAGLIQRAAFACEPIVRGLRGGQLSMSIDGMKIHSACVDKMDPATSYVELDNVRTLQLTEGTGDVRYGSTLGGSLNFTMQQPPLGGPLRAAAELSYDANANGRRLRCSSDGGTGQGMRGDVAYRVGYTFRDAHDYKAGDDTTIGISGFTKHNLALAASWKAGTSQTLTASFIGDLATDVGFPSMYMDTRRAEAIIGSVDWKQSFAHGTLLTWKLYGNHVRHWMDDSSRSVSEIESRPFMPGMYMPMYGVTTTIGTIGDISTTIGDDLLTITFDAFTMHAYADMFMIPLANPNVQSSLVTIGNARATTIALAPVYEHLLSESITLRVNGRLEGSKRSLEDADSRTALGSYAPVSNFDPLLVAGSIGASLYYRTSDALQWSFGVGRAQRLPTHIEQYGYYLYDPGSNIITIGDPDLSVETSYNAEVGSQYASEDVALAVMFSATRVNDYIAAAPAADEDPSVLIRQYHNIGSAQLFSASLRWTWRMSDAWTASGTMNATQASMITETENLPLIPAPQATLRIALGDAAAWVAAQGRFVAPQRNASQRILPEDTTPGFALLDFTAAATFFERLTVRGGLLNVFDTFYHEHTSIRNVPAKGRTFTLSLGYAFQ
ncbi:MAG: TonB-dependent receptor [Bacteroidetes bacterium]|nr:TonB-dependent receptor [Bacteroidota bacterium]